MVESVRNHQTYKSKPIFLLGISKMSRIRTETKKYSNVPVAAAVKDACALSTVQWRAEADLMFYSLHIQIPPKTNEN